MFRSGITYGAMSLKALLIVNGGAATVLLAFISRVVTEDGVGSKLVIGLAPSMESFVAGLIFCVIAIGSTYMTQSCYQHDHLRFGIFFHVVAVAGFLASLGAFSWGTLSATMLFSGG